jgi:hypothetical protein
MARKILQEIMRKSGGIKSAMKAAKVVMKPWMCSI